MPSRRAVLIVIDGLTPSVFESAVEDRSAPTLAQLADAGTYRRAVTTFPSLTPVCLTSIATGAHPDVHHIPHLVWWNRQERRIVEYGSSFGAIRAAGTRRSIRDTIVGMNRDHLSKDAETIYEAAERAGLTAAAVNITCYRGSHRYLPTVPGIAPATFGPRRFFFYNLYESDPIGAPLAVRDRAHGSVDEYAAAAGRWLVTRDGFDLLVYYLSDIDFASHLHGPDGVREQLVKTDGSVRALVDAAGGVDEFLERYAVLVCSDHGQTHVDRAVRLQDHVRSSDTVTASNRAGMIYTDDPRAAAVSLDPVEAVDATFFLEDGAVVARRDGDEDATLLDEYPLGRERVTAALRNPNAGEVLVSAADGWEFADLAGLHHAGGGSHGSLTTGDSEVPILGVGIDPPARTIDVKDAMLSILRSPVT
ncbi:MAG TPA: nucleotide pyrophosphatase/phosphodiesterase family protein [Gaiellaceae bacterium]